jgi:hypothetical protein
MPPSLIDPGGYDPREWSWWWQRVALTGPNDRVGGLWEDFGGGRFYETAAVPLEGDYPRGESVNVVRHLAWVADERTGLWYRRTDHSGRTDFGRPVRVFSNRHEADAFRSQTERQDRTGRNPFDHVRDDAGGPLAGRTSLVYPLLHDWLLDSGAVHIPNPDSTASGWQAWWERTVPKLSPLQQAKAWEAFDRVRLYDVVEVPWDDGRESS